MGAPKLLLPLQGSPLIAHTITAWQAGGLAPLVVVRPGDQKLIEACRGYGAEVLIPEITPPEMKVSVRLALEHLQQRYRPPPDFAWLLAPADMPRLSPAVIGRLLGMHRLNLQQTESPPILVPVCGGRRGHPVLFPWPMAAQVSSLGEEESVKTLFARNPVCEVPCDDLLPSDQPFLDVDTPTDYARLGGTGRKTS